MPRIRLMEQETYGFSYSVQVRPQDINYSGHVGNDNLISLVGAARAFTFHSLGFSEMDLGDGHTGVIMTDLAVNYKAEAYLFDNLSVETHAGEFGRSGFRMFHRVSRGEKTIALVETGFATFNYAAKKVALIPQVFLAAITGSS
jgi:acyl-CoA thioester hydrolase